MKDDTVASIGLSIAFFGIMCLLIGFKSAVALCIAIIVVFILF